MRTQMDSSASKIERNVQRLVALGIACLLLLPGTAALVGVEPAAIENRPLASWPGFSWGSLVDTAATSKISTYLTEHLRLRKAVVAARAEFTLEVFDDSPSAMVHLGNKGWLYYDLTFTRACSEGGTPREIVSAVRRVGEIVERSGRRFVFMVAPDKRSIYPEFMGAKLRRLALCADQKRQELQRYLEHAPPPGYVDLFRVMGDLKENSQEKEPIYYPNDTHWTTFSSGKMAQAIVDVLSPGLWKESGLVSTGEKGHLGDLTSVMGVPRRIPSDQFIVLRPGLKIEDSRTKRDPYGVRSYRTVGDRPRNVVPGRVFFLHDSFTYDAIPMLALYLEESRFLHWENVWDAKTLAGEIRAADIIVVQIAERGSYNWVNRVFTQDVLLRNLAGWLRP